MSGISKEVNNPHVLYPSDHLYNDADKIIGDTGIGHKWAVLYLNNIKIYNTANLCPIPVTNATPLQDQVIEN